MQFCCFFELEFTFSFVILSEKNKLKSTEVPETPAITVQDAAATQTLQTPPSGMNKKVLQHCTLHKFSMLLMSLLSNHVLGLSSRGQVFSCYSVVFKFLHASVICHRKRNPPRAPVVKVFDSSSLQNRRIKATHFHLISNYVLIVTRIT